MKYSDKHVLDSWLSFVSSVDSLSLRIVPKYRHTDKFDDFWSEMIKFVSSVEVSSDITNGYLEFENGGKKVKPKSTKSDSEETNNAADLVVLEIDTYNKAALTLKKQLNTNKPKKGAIKSLFGKAKTVVGSVQDVFGLTSIGKQATTLFKEGVELFEE